MQSYPFTSQVTYDEQGRPLYDRAVDSEFLRSVFAAYFSDGVFYKPTNALQVVAGTGMQVQVNPGICHIRGAIGIETDTRTLAVEAAGTSPRIDTVVARLDLSLAIRSIELYVIKGTPSSNPQRPALTRDSTIWELGLADISIAANSSSITQSNISDTRLDTDRCGIVAQTIGSLDTAPYFEQLAAAIAAHQKMAEEQIEALQDAIEAVEGNTAWMLKKMYDSKGRKKDIFDTMAANAPMYTALYKLDGWTAADEGAKGKGYAYQQTVELEPDDGDAPTVNESSVFVTGCTYLPTGVAATDEVLGEALAIINAGYTTSGTGTVTTLVKEKPTSDIPVRWAIRTEVT